jgi:hypothetical protein
VPGFGWFCDQAQAGRGDRNAGDCKHRQRVVEQQNADYCGKHRTRAARDGIRDREITEVVGTCEEPHVGHVRDAAERSPHPRGCGNPAEGEHKDRTTDAGNEELPPQSVPFVAALFDDQVPAGVQNSRSDCKKSGPDHVFNVLVTASP